MAPFLSGFPRDPKKAHFIGMPIDYVIFDDDAVIFLEIKSGQSSLSQRQKQIKDLILNGKVKWEEYRIDGKVQKTSTVQGTEISEMPGVSSSVREAPSETS